mgnify:CR=1 FL=1
MSAQLAQSIKEAAAKISEEVAKNCGSVPQLTFPHIYLGLQEFAASLAAHEAAPQQEPVAWVDERAIGWLKGRGKSASITTPLQTHKSAERPMPLYAAPQQAQAPAMQECYGDCATGNPQTCPNPCSFQGRPQQAQAPGWQDIATAPKDMDTYLFLCNGVAVQGFRDATGELCVCLEAGASGNPPWRRMRRKPTHWAHRLAAPQQGSNT